MQAVSGPATWPVSIGASDWRVYTCARRPFFFLKKKKKKNKNKGLNFIICKDEGLMLFKSWLDIWIHLIKNIPNHFVHIRLKKDGGKFGDEEGFWSTFFLIVLKPSHWYLDVAPNLAILSYIVVSIVCGPNCPNLRTMGLGKDSWSLSYRPCAR